MAADGGGAAAVVVIGEASDRGVSSPYTTYTLATPAAVVIGEARASDVLRQAAAAAARLESAQQGGVVLAERRDGRARPDLSYRDRGVSHT